MLWVTGRLLSLDTAGRRGRRFIPTFASRSVARSPQNMQWTTVLRECSPSPAFRFHCMPAVMLHETASDRQSDRSPLRPPEVTMLKY